MEAKQISLFCLLLAALAGKIETKPSGSLNALSAEQQTLQNAEQDIVSLETTSLSIGSAGSFGTGSLGSTGSFGTGSLGSTGSFGTGSLGSTGSFGTGSLGSTGNFGTGISGAGLQRGCSNCGQGSSSSFAGIGAGGAGLQRGCSNCGQGTYPLYSGIGSSGLGLGGIGGSQNLPFTSLGCLGQQQNLPFTSLGCLGQQQYGSLSNCNPCGTTGSQGGLDFSYLPCTSCNQVGTQDLGYGCPCGLQSGFDGIPFNSNYGLRQSLPSYSADFSCLGNTQLQGISDYGGYGAYQQGITGCTGCSPSLQPCTSCSENTCASSVDSVIVLPVAECGVEPTCTETC